MASAALHVPQAAMELPRPALRVATTDGKQPQRSTSSSSLMAAASSGLTGVSFEVTDYNDISPIAIRSAPKQEKHSTLQQQAVAPRPVHARMGATALSPVLDNSPMTPPLQQLRSPSSPQRQEAGRASPPSHQSSRSNSPPTAVRRHSDRTERVDTPTEPLKSMFPQLEPGVPLQQQAYLPVNMPAVHLPRQQISKGVEVNSSLASPQGLTIQVPERHSEPVLPPVASRAEALELWNLANAGKPASTLDTVHLDLRVHTLQNGQRNMTRPGIEIALATTTSQPLYTARLAPCMAPPGDPSLLAGDLDIQRIHPTESGTFPVAQLDTYLPIEGFTSNGHDGGVIPVTSIFPQVAALSAIRSVADSLQARSIARFDPDAASPQAARLAFDAVQSTKEAEESTLTYRLPTTGSTETYIFGHPTLGSLPVSLRPNTRINLFDLSTSAAPYRPHAPATSQQGRLTLLSADARSELAVLDLSTQRLSLNTPAILGTGCEFLVDAVVGALVAVAVAETFRPENGGYATYFAGPPRTPAGTVAGRPTSLLSVGSGKKEGRWSWLSKGKRKGKVETVEEEGAVKVPVVLRGAFKVMGWGFEAIIWVLSLGAKVVVKLLGRIFK